MAAVLVIEDSPIILKILGHMFRRTPEYEAVFCASAAEAEILLDSAEHFVAAVADLRPMLVKPSFSRRRTTALPTMPRWPAT